MTWYKTTAKSHEMCCCLLLRCAVCTDAQISLMSDAQTYHQVNAVNLKQCGPALRTTTVSRWCPNRHAVISPTSQKCHLCPQLAEASVTVAPPPNIMVPPTLTPKPIILSYECDDAHPPDLVVPHRQHTGYWVQWADVKSVTHEPIPNVTQSTRLLSVRMLGSWTIVL